MTFLLGCVEIRETDTFKVVLNEYEYLKPLLIEISPYTFLLCFNNHPPFILLALPKKLGEFTLHLHGFMSEFPKRKRYNSDSFYDCLFGILGFTFS